MGGLVPNRNSQNWLQIPIFSPVFGSFDFCLPTRSTSVPATPEWLHEVKYDGYRLRVERDGDRVRLITRGGYNWTDRYPWIVEAARKIRQKQFVLDGEAVVLGVDGISDFDALHSRKHDDEVQFCAFDILALDGDDLRKLPLSMRKTNLDKLLARRPEGVIVNPFERGEIGPDLFRAACRMRDLPFPTDTVKRPQYFGILTNDIVYKRLAPGVFDELKRVTPRDEETGRHKQHLFRRLTSNTGYPKLREHLGSVVTIMKLSKNYGDFKEKLDQLHPKYGETMRLPFDYDDRADDGKGI